MAQSASNTPTPTTPSVLPMVYPMDDFYAQMSLPLPKVESVPGESVPEPERSLLVHGNDMTSTLTAFHKGRLHLEVLRSELRGDYYLREVVLRLDGSNKPVEFGAIKIYLNLLPGPARRLILDEKLPLGQILKECSVAYISRPKAFLKVISDERISRALQIQLGSVMYGRRNTLADPQQRPLAEIVEILPPEPPLDGGQKTDSLKVRNC